MNPSKTLQLFFSISIFSMQFIGMLLLAAISRFEMMQSVIFTSVAISALTTMTLMLLFNKLVLEPVDQLARKISAAEGGDSNARIKAGSFFGIWDTYSDIIDRKHAEAAFQEPQQMLQNVLDTIPVRVFWKDVNSVIQGGNKLFWQDAGLNSMEELVGKRDVDLYPGEGATFVLDDKAILESGEALIDHEEYQTAPDGEIMWLQTNKVPLRDADGNIIGILGTYTDITDRKHAESALQKSQQMLQNVLDTIPVRVFWKDINSAYQGANKLFVQDAGCDSLEDLIGKTDFEVFSREAYLYRADDRKVMESGEARVNYEESQTTPTDDVIWLQTSKIPLRDADGNVIGILGTYTDITDRKHAETALQESQQMLQNVLDTIPVRVFWKDINSAMRGANNLFLQDTGLSSMDDLIGITPTELYPAEGEQHRADDLAVMESDEARINFEESMTMPDGSTMWAQTSKVPLKDSRGDVIGILGTYVDITEQKRAEASLQDSEAKLSAIFNQSHDLQVLYAIGADGMLQVDAINQTYLKQSLTAKDGSTILIKTLVGKELTKILSSILGYDDEVVDEIRGHYQRAITTKKIQIYEEFMTASTPEHYLQSTLTPIFDADGTCRYVLFNGRNITEQKIAERRINKLLIESERKTKRYYALFEQSTDAIVAVNLNYRITDCNSAALEMFGFSREELVGSPVSLLIPLSEEESAYDSPEMLLKGEKVLPYEQIVHRKSGEVFPVDVKLALIKTDDGDEEPYFQAIVRDITERKAAEDALRDSEARLSAIFNQSNDLQLLYKIETDGTFRADAVNQTYLTESFAAVDGLTIPQDRIIGKTLPQILHDVIGFDDPRVDEILDYYQQVIDTGQSVIYEESLHAASQEHHVQVTLTPIYDTDETYRYVLFNARNITERKIAERRINELLAESERQTQRYRGLFEQSRDAILLFNIEGIILNCNQAALDILGYDNADELVGQPISITVSQDENSASQQQLQRLLDGELLTPYERTLRRKSGKRFVSEVSVALIQDGDAPYLQSIFRDVSERKRAEEALRESEANLKEAQKIARLGNYSLDFKTQAMTYSDEIYQIYGLPTDLQITNETFQNLLEPVDWERINQAVEHLIATGTPYEIDYAIRLPDGSKKYLSTTGQPITDSNGAVIKVFGTIQDVTERKEAAVALESSEQRLLLSVRVGNVGIFDYDHLTDTAYWSPEIRVIHGWELDESLTVAAARDHVHPDDFDRVNEAVQQAWDPAGDGTYEVEHRIITRSGETRWVSIRSRTFFEGKGDKQHPVRTVGAMLDITERRQQEEDLRESETRLRRAENIANMGYISSYRDGSNLTASNGCKRIWGFDLDSTPTFDDIVSHIHPDDRQIIVDSLEQSAQTMLGFDVEYRVIRTDGSVRTVQSIGEANVEEHTGKQAIFGAIMDITERKEAEASLELSEQRLSLSISVGNIGIFDHDHHTDTVYWSPELRSMYGWGLDEVISVEDSIKHVHSADRKRIEEAVQQTWDSAGDGTYDVEYRMIDRSGIIHWISIRARTFFEGDGEDRHPTRTIGAVRDITERKEAEASLELSENRLSLSINVGNIGIFDHNHLTSEVYWSPELRSIYGWEPDELITIADGFGYVHPVDREWVGKAVQQAWNPAGDGTYDVEYRIIDRDGVVHWISIRSQTFFEGDGEERHPTRTIGAVRDITERKQQEEHLRESEARLRRAESIANMGYLSGDRDGSNLTASDGWKRIWDFDLDSTLTTEEIIARVHPDDRHIVVDGLEQSAVTVADFDIEYRVIRTDGSVRTVQSIGEVNIDENTGKQIFFSTILDVTERKEAEASLELSEKRLSLSINVGNIGIFDYDHLANTVYWSPELRSMYGWEPNEFISSEDSSKHVHPADFEWLGKAMQQAVHPEGDGTFDVEYRIIDRSGEIHWVSVRSRTFFEGDGDKRHPVRTIGAVMDITERKQMENALRDSETKLSAIFEQSKDLQAIYKVGSDGTFRFDAVNQAFVNQLLSQEIPISVDALIGKSLQELLVDEDMASRIIGRHQQVIETGEALSYETSPDTPELRGYYEAILTPIFDSQGTCLYTFYNARNVTDHKLAEKALRDSEAKLAAIFNQSSDMKMLYAVEPNGTLRIDSVNETFINHANQHGFTLTPDMLFGETLENVLANTFGVDSDRLSQLVALHNKVVTTGEMLRYEEIISTPLGPVYTDVMLIPIFDTSDICHHVLYSARDITDRKLAEEALRDSETKLTAIFDQTNDLQGLFRVEPDGTLRADAVNQSLINLMKQQNIDASVDMLLGKTLQEIIGSIFGIEEDTISLVLGYHKQVIETGESLSYETKHDTPRWGNYYQNVVTPIFDSHGICRYTLYNSRDITDRKQAEENLRDSEAKLSAIFDQSSDMQAIISMGSSGVFNLVAINRTYIDTCRAAGLELSEPDVVGKSMREFLSDVFAFDDDTINHVCAIYEEVVSTGKPVTNESVLQVMGYKSYLESTYVPIFDSSGIFRYILFNGRDITERKLAEKRISELHAETERQSQHYRALFEQSRDAILIFDTDFLCRNGNRAAVDMFGYQVDEFIGKHMSELVPVEDRTETYGERVRKVLRGEDVPSYERKMLRNNGEKFFAEISISTIRDVEDHDKHLVQSIVRDITERKQAEQKIIEHQKLLQAMMDTMPDIVYIYDVVNHKETFSNRSIAGMLGYTAEETEKMGGNVVRTLMHEDDVARLPERRKHIARLADNEILENEYRIRNKHGEWRWMHTRDTVFERDENGVPTRLIGVTRDSTEGKRAENAIIEHQKLIQGILDTIPDVVYIYDLEQERNTFQNRNIAEDLGYSAAEIAAMGDRVLNLLIHHEDDASLHKHHHRIRQLQDREIIEREYRIRHKDGDWRWIYTRDIVFARNASGVPIQIIGVAHDITERKQDEETIRENQRFIQAILDAMPDIVYMYDLEQYKDVFHTRHVGEDLGYSAAEIAEMGDKFLEILIHDDDNAKLPEHHARIRQLKDRDIIKREYRIRHKNGSWRWMATRDVVFTRDDAGLPNKLLGVAQDITENKLFVDELTVLVDELEQKNAELERFTYTVSHDLKSPLITIKSFLGLLKLDIANQDEERIDSDITYMTGAATQMERLLEDLLELSRIGRIVNPPEVIHLSELINEAVALVRGQIDNRGVQVHIDENLPDAVGDRSRILEVFQNLISNAVKYMGDQSDPQVWVGASLDKANNQIICYVRDNGMGIEERYHEVIFGLFERLSNDEDGTGIGLALVKRIVNLHGGEIWVESDGLNRGSNFLFTLAITK